MKISEMINELNKIKSLCGDIEIYLHDSGDGNDYKTTCVYIDEGYDNLPDECIIGFDHDLDVR